jgi:predicted DNA-binding transcriptional regulator AlpA
MTDPTLRLQAPVAPKPRSFSASARNPDLADANECARLLGISRSSLERRLANKTAVIPRPFSIGAKRLWRRADVEEFLRAAALLGRTPR